MDLGSTIKKLRLEKKITAHALSALARCHPSDISKIEHGMMVPYAPLLERIAGALELTGDELKRQAIELHDWENAWRHSDDEERSK